MNDEQAKKALLQCGCARENCNRGAHSLSSAPLPPAHQEQAVQVAPEKRSESAILRFGKKLRPTLNAWIGGQSLVPTSRRSIPRRCRGPSDCKQTGCSSRRNAISCLPSAMPFPRSGSLLPITAASRRTTSGAASSSKRTATNRCPIAPAARVPPRSSTASPIWLPHFIR